MRAHLWVVLCVPRVQRDRLQIQPAVQVDSRDNVPTAARDTQAVQAARSSAQKNPASTGRRRGQLDDRRCRRPASVPALSAMPVQSRPYDQCIPAAGSSVARVPSHQRCRRSRVGGGGSGSVKHTTSLADGRHVGRASSWTCPIAGVIPSEAGGMSICWRCRHGGIIRLSKAGRRLLVGADGWVAGGVCRGGGEDSR